MNTRLCKFLLPLCLLSSFAFSQPIANAGPTTNAEPRFDIQIEEGQLSLEPLKGRVDIKEIWGPEDTHSVLANIKNLSKYLRAVDTNLNIVVAPQAAAVQIKDLKLRAADMAEVAEAAEIATDEAVHGGPSPGKNNWHFGALAHYIDRKVEVFNISLYINSLGNENDAKVGEKLDQIKLLIANTLKELHAGDSKQPELPQINFHSGTSLLIVVGTPEAIEVTRKIINALPGLWTMTQLHELDIPASQQQK
jgi:hypothetical protein